MHLSYKYISDPQRHWKVRRKCGIPSASDGLPEHDLLSCIKKSSRDGPSGHIIHKQSPRIHSKHTDTPSQIIVAPPLPNKVRKWNPRVNAMPKYITSEQKTTSPQQSTSHYGYTQDITHSNWIKKTPAI